MQDFTAWDAGLHRSYDPDSLQHYGVLGMKWGVRRNPQKAYEKAEAHLIKLQAKADKASGKAIKARSKDYKAQAKARSIEKKMNKATKRGADDLKIQKLSDKQQKINSKATDTKLKANKATIKYAKANNDVKTWTNQMLKAFKAADHEELKKKFGRAA